MTYNHLEKMCWSITFMYVWNLKSIVSAVIKCEKYKKYRNKVNFVVIDNQHLVFIQIMYEITVIFK